MLGHPSRSLRFRLATSLCILILAMSAALSGAQEKDDAKLVQDFNYAVELQTSGLFADAAAAWDKFVNKYGTDERAQRAYYNLGVCQLATKEYSDAAKAFQSLVKKFPKGEKVDAARFNLAVAHFQEAAAGNDSKKFAEAAARFKEAVDANAKSEYADRALYFRGEALYSADQKDAAVEAFKHLTDQYKQSPLLAEAYYGLGTLEQELGNLDEAAKAYQNFLSDEKRRQHAIATEVQMRLGIVLYQQEKFAEAEKQFAELGSIENFPRADFALLRRAQCRYEQKDVEGAARLFAQLVNDFPETKYREVAQLASGKCFHALGKWNDARKPLEPLAKQKGAVGTEAAYWLSQSLMRLDKANDALKVLDEAQKLGPEGEFAPHVELARIDALYRMPDKRAETAQQYVEFVKRHADHELASHATYMAALAALAGGDYKTTREQAETFLGNANNAEHKLRPEVLFLAGEGHLLGAENGQPGADLNQAGRYYWELVKAYPDHKRTGRATLRVGHCLEHNGKYDEALRIVSEAKDQFQKPEHRAEAALILGRCHWSKDRGDEALASLEEAVKAKADWARGDEVLLLLGNIYRERKDFDKAKSHLERLASQFGESSLRGQAFQLLGDVALAEGKPDQAISRYKQAQQATTDEQNAPLIAYGIGAAYLASDDPSAAIGAYDTLLSNYGDSEVAAPARYWRGVAKYRLDKFSEAITDLKAYLGTAADGTLAPDALHTIVLCQVKEKNLTEAKATIDTLAAKHGDFEDLDKAYYELGHGWLDSNDAEKASEAFQSLISKTPESPLAAEGWFHIGRYRESADPDSPDLTGAVTAYQSGLDRAETDELKEKLLFKIGVVQFQSEKYDEAAPVLRRQVDQFPNGELASQGSFFLAECLYRKDDFAGARPLYEQVAKNETPELTARAIYRAGDCAAQAKDFNGSKQLYQKLVNDYPKFEKIDDARYGLAWSMQNLGDTQNAEKLYGRIVEESDGEVAAKSKFMLGEIAFGEKKYDEAVKDFLAAAVYPYDEWQAMARFEAGRCLMQLAKDDAAIKQFQAVIDDHAEHPRAKDAARLLAELSN